MTNGNGHHSHGNYSHGLHDHHVLRTGAPDNGNHFHGTCLAFPPACKCCDHSRHPVSVQEYGHLDGERTRKATS